MENVALLAPPMTDVLLVLAAGRGRRMGGPKALLLIGDEPLALLHARTHERVMQGMRVVRVVIVTTEDVRGLLASDSRADITFVAPDRPHELGPAGSIGAAVRSGALDGVSRVAITPVDVLPAPPSRIAALLDALVTHEAALSPRGHPVALRGEVLRAGYRDANPILRDFLATLGCARLPPDEAGVLTDLDTPDDVVRITGSAPRFLVR